MGGDDPIRYWGDWAVIHDFIVVGAGMAGASIAYELAAHGRVCILEREEMPGFHSTGRSAALFAPSYGAPEIRALTRASRAFFECSPPGFAESTLITPRGCLYIARADQLGRLRGMARSIAASGGNIALVDGDAAEAYVPLLRRDYIAQAAMDMDAMDIDVDAVHTGYLRGARARGASLRANAALTACVRRNGVWEISTLDGVVRGAVLVNAAGAWGDEVAAASGAAPIGLCPLRRTALLIDPPHHVDVRDWPAVIDADEAFYFKPEAGKLLLSPADETPDVCRDAQPEELDIAIAVDRVQAALDIEVRRITHSWAGLRTFTPDRLPAVGYDPHVEGLFWCVGQGGYGIQMAPALARLAACLVLNAPPPADIVETSLDIESLSPRRFIQHPSSARRPGSA